MKRFIDVIILFLIGVCMLVSSYVNASAANLVWDASTGEVDGYIAYCSDGVNEYNLNVGNVTTVTDIENTFNLEPNTEYTFTVTAFNEYGESERSNTALYTWTIESFTPPEDYLPPEKVYILGPVEQVIVNP